MTVVTNETWKDASGEKQERAEFHRVVVFNDRVADVAEKYLRKGRKVYVEGSLQTRKWTDQSGQEKYSTEVVIGRFKGELVLIDSARDEAPASAPGAAVSRAGGAPLPPRQPARAGADLDDEIPF